MKKENIKYLARLDLNINKKKIMFSKISLITSLSIFLLCTLIIVSVLFSFLQFVKNNKGIYILYKSSSVDIASMRDDVINDDIIGKDIKYDDKIEFISYSLYTYYKTGFESSDVNSLNPIVAIDGVETGIYDYNKSENTLTFYDFDNSKIYSDKEKKELSNDIVFGKEAIASNELLISKQLCIYLGLSIDAVIGKSISYKINVSNPRNVFDKEGNKITTDNKKQFTLFSEFVIAGVFNDELFSLPSREKVSAPVFIFNKECLNNDFIEYQIDNNGKVCFYYNEDIDGVNMSSMTNKKVSIPYGYNGINHYNINYNLLFYSNVNLSYKSYKKIMHIMSESYSDSNSNYVEPTITSDFTQNLYDNYSTFIIAALLLLGITILLCLNSIYNLNQTLLIVIKNKKKNTLIFKYIGGKGDEARLINCYEIKDIFIKVLFFVTLIFASISIAYILIYTSYLKRVNVEFSFSSFIILFLIMTIITYCLFIIYFLVLSLKNKKIIKHLYERRQDEFYDKI